MKVYRFASIRLACAALAAMGAASAPEIDWWRTQGAAVVEYRAAPEGQVCSLFFYSRNAAAVVTWTKSGEQTISLYHNDWHFVPGQQVGVALQIGDAWLATPAGSQPAQLPATTYADHLSIPVQPPLPPLLQHADGITARLGDRTLSVAVDPFRMKRILHAVHRCRAAVARE